MKILFATTNEGKMAEIKKIAEGSGVEFVSLRGLGIDCDIKEDGATFMENALIKARAAHNLSGLDAAADDSGLAVDYLNGEPGVYSARYMGEGVSYEIKNKKIIELLDGAPDDKRTARFKCAMAFVGADGAALCSEASIEGRIAYEPAGSNGFGYDPIFYIPRYKATAAELDIDIKNKISHRGLALRFLIEKIRARYGVGNAGL